MRKILLLLLIGSLGTLPGNASASINQDGKSTTIQRGNTGNTSAGRPRSMHMQPTFQVQYEPGMDALLVSSSSDVGLVHAVIDNLFTGAVFSYSFDSSETAILPYNGEPGLWRLTIFLNHNAVVTYLFQED